MISTSMFEPPGKNAREHRKALALTGGVTFVRDHQIDELMGLSWRLTRDSRLRLKTGPAVQPVVE